MRAREQAPAGRSRAIVRRALIRVAVALAICAGLGVAVMTSYVEDTDGSLPGNIVDTHGSIRGSAAPEPTDTVAVTDDAGSALQIGPETRTSLRVTAGGPDPARTKVPAGTSVKLTAQVTQPGGAALPSRSDGYIEFYDNGMYLGDGAIVDELGWRAEFTISNPAPGPHSFTAAYRSLASYLDSESTHHRIDVELPAVGRPVDGEVPAWGATG